MPHRYCNTIDYGNSRLLFRLQIYRYDKDNGGDDYGNKKIILKLRTERGMSQDELANKVMVTRQAVSRWENGDTVPNTDTLRLLSKNLMFQLIRFWENQEG